MSVIPPNWLASGIQSLAAQQKAGEAHSKDAADQARRTGESPFAKQLENVINESDRDSQVDADAEGAGGQGRASAEQHEHEPAAQSDEKQTPATGLDIQA